jgi:uncharacterized SAM-binding protein YcdF (DUF218 family)
MSKKWYQRTDGVTSRPPGRRFPLGCLPLVVLLLLVLTARWWLPGLARALVVDQPLAPANAILVLGGGDGSREDRALALYQQGLAPVIIVSGEKPYLPGEQQTFAEISAAYLHTGGVPDEALLLLTTTTSTRDEAVQSLQLAQEQSFSSLIVVTDAYHARRASLAFYKVYRRANVRLTFVSAYPSWLLPDSWWTEERPLIAVVEEYEKLLLYLFKGYIL